MSGPPRRFRVLFLCTHNSARSQIAEAVLRARAGDRFTVASAGSHPADRVHPMALDVIESLGGNAAEHRTKGFEDVLPEEWDLVITVCDQAREACPALPDRTVTAHWSMVDPSAVEGTPAERRAAFEQAYRSLAIRINLLLSLGPEKIERLALRSRVKETESPLELAAAASAPEAVVALLSDIHGNLPALQSVLLDIDERGDATAVYHLGDLVGYGPWPDEVVELLDERGIHGVSGNYDSTVATDYRHCGCKYEDPKQEALSHISFAWTKQHTTPATKRRLGALPFRLDVRPLGGHAGGPRIILVHGNPTLNTFYWTDDRDDAFCLKMADQAGARPGDVIAFGHTHRPWYRVVEGVHFVNTGSVGRPKDGDPRAGYVRIRLTEGAFDVEHVRVEYDLDRAMRGIRESELPSEFAEHLRTGGSAS